MKKTDEHLHSQLNHFIEVLSAITDMMPDRHFIVDEKGLILSRFGNAKFEQFYDFLGKEPRSIIELTTQENMQKTLTALKQSLLTKEIVTFEVSSELTEIKKIRKNINGPATKQWFEVRVMPLKFVVDDNNVLIVSVRNITERKRSEITLSELTVTDSLTQLYNRRYAKEELTRCLQRYSRYNTDISVLMLDIDFFKNINDTHGHDVGDLVLIALSQFLQENVRSLDTIARIGGEEFLVIMPDVAVQTVQPFYERLIRNIEALEIPIPGGLLSITVSGGLSQFMEADDTIETLLKRIDVALYRSKNEGRNRITVA